MKLTTRNLVLVLGLLLLVIVLLPIVIGMLMGNMMASGMMGSGMMGSGMMGGMMGSGQISGWSWGLMMALASLRTIAVLGALVIGGLLLVRALQDQSRQPGQR